MTPLNIFMQFLIQCCMCVCLFVCSFLKWKIGSWLKTHAQVFSWCVHNVTFSLQFYNWCSVRYVFLWHRHTRILVLVILFAVFTNRCASNLVRPICYLFVVVFLFVADFVQLLVKLFGTFFLPCYRYFVNFMR